MEILTTPLYNVSNMMVHAIAEAIQAQAPFSGRFHLTNDGGIVFINMNSVTVDNKELLFSEIQNQFQEFIQNEIEDSQDSDEPLSINDYDFSEFTFVKQFIDDCIKARKAGVWSFEVMTFESI